MLPSFSQTTVQESGLETWSPSAWAPVRLSLQEALGSAAHNHSVLQFAAGHMPPASPFRSRWGSKFNRQMWTYKPINPPSLGRHSTEQLSSTKQLPMRFRKRNTSACVGPGLQDYGSFKAEGYSCSHSRGEGMGRVLLAIYTGRLCCYTERVYSVSPRS